MNEHLSITIATGGRFHADRMASAFLANGHTVNFFTSFPRNAFPTLPPQSVHPLLLPELAFRAFRHFLPESAERWKRQLFARELSKAISRIKTDVFISWSSFGLEAMKSERVHQKVVVRDSTHIRFQMNTLKSEFEAYRLPFSYPTDLVAREEEEYALSDYILVLSEFAKRTFVELGVPEEKMGVLKMGVDLSRFSARQKGCVTLPLKVIYFGNISIRKGIPYLLEATKDFISSELSITLLGDVEPCLKPLMAKYSHFEHITALPQSRLPSVLKNFDVFVFPTMEDGFGQTLLQAMACGLVPIVSNRCGAAEVIESEKNGFVIPAGSTIALKEMLKRLVEWPFLIEQAREESLTTATTSGWDSYSLGLNQWLRKVQSRHRLIQSKTNHH